MEKVSIIVPIYNVEEYLPKCFESLLNQTYKNIEILAVNDGSPDNSQKIIDDYAAQDERIISLMKTNGGLSDARNYAMPHASGEYFFFLDSDDYLELDAIEKLVSAAKTTGADLVLCGYHEVNLKNNTVTDIISEYSFEPGSLKDHPMILNSLPHCAWNKLYHRSLFMDTDIRYPKGLYYEDCATSPRIYLEAKKIAYLPCALINYLVDRPGNITTKVNRKILDVAEDLRIVNQYFKDKNEFDFFRSELCYFNLRLVFDNSWKLKYAEDSTLTEEFIQRTYRLLNEWFPEWRKSSYFNSDGLKGMLIDWMKKNPNIYKKYLMK